MMPARGIGPGWVGTRTSVRWGIMSIEMPNVCARVRRLRFSGTAPRGVALLGRLAVLALMALPAAALGQGTASPPADPVPSTASERPAAPPSAAPQPAAPAPAAATGQPPAPSSPPASAQPATPAPLPRRARQRHRHRRPHPVSPPAPSAGSPVQPTSSPTASPAPADAPSSPGIGSLQLPRDLSPWSMFMSADKLVQAS